MPDRNLHAFAVTSDPTISQVLHALTSVQGTPWKLILFDEPVRVLSAQAESLDFLLLDEAVPGSNYIALIKKARRRYPMVNTFVIGGPKSDDVKLAQRRQGVDYYAERPLDEAFLRHALERRLNLARLKSVAGIIGRSLSIEEVLEAVLQLAPTEVPILLEGESGTGKDVIARAIHQSSRRSQQSYVAINVASLSEGVLESELFGHEKGAFTGAVAQRAGVFERADRGTLFLDEVGEMSPNMQVRLLRVLETGEVLRVGGVKSFKVDVRVISATNRRLAQAVKDGTFRQDLYYRLKGVSFYLPPLRERKEDIATLVGFFISEANRKHGTSIKGIQPSALQRIESAHMPGNIRELKNLVDTAVVLASGDRISEEVVASRLSEPDSRRESLLPIPLNRSRDEAEREMIYASVLALHRDVREIMAMLRHAIQGRPLDALREVHRGMNSDAPENSPPVPNLSHLERQAIAEALRSSEGNRRKAAEMLGISERTLYRKIKEYGLV